MITVKEKEQVPLVPNSLVKKSFYNIPGLKWLLVLIPLLYVLSILFFPLLELFKLSFYDETGFTLKYVNQLFSSTVYFKVLWITLKISAIVTVICLLLSYPIAYLLVKLKSNKWKGIIITITLLPFWISLLVRTFSWIIVLQNEGIVNKLLLSLGIISEPVNILYTTTAVTIGMAHVMYPFMFFSLYSVMNGIDQRLQEAAESLGARPIQSFFQVFFPLSIPGVLAGSLLVFVMSLGFFIVPALIGSSNDMMISVLIENYINKTLNWNLASLLSLVLFATTVIVLFIVFLLLRKQPIMKDVV